MSSKITLSGFGETNLNGEYYFSHNVNGLPLYRKDIYTYITYADSLMPYSNHSGYYIIRLHQIQGSIGIEKVRYWTTTKNPALLGSATWFSTADFTSLSDTTTSTGTVSYDDFSSSSSSSSSIDSSSSSSSNSSSSSSIDSSSSSSSSL